MFWGGEGLPVARHRHSGRKGYILSGSDCGRVFIWDRESTRLVDTLNGDSDILNCVQVGQACVPNLCTHVQILRLRLCVCRAGDVGLRAAQSHTAVARYVRY